MKSLRTILGTPVLHLVMGGFFALVFAWPFVAFRRPVTVFCFLVGAWAASILTAFFLSLGQDDDATLEGIDDDGGDVDV